MSQRAGAGPHRRVVVVGDVMTDIIVRPTGSLVPGSDRRAVIETHAGGSGANQAAWLAAAGLDVSFVGRVAVADLARHAGDLKRHGVTPVLAGDPDRPSGTLVALIGPDGERSFLTDRGANDGLTGADLDRDLLDGADLLHVSGYALVEPGPREAVLAFVAEARMRGVAVSWDPGSTGFLAEIGTETFRTWTRGAALCCANAEEADLLAGSPDPAKQMARLAAGYDLVVIKRGALGAEAGDRDGGRWSVSAPAVKVLDTTGAGDAFLAGFLAVWLAAGPIEAALQRGSEWGALATTRTGGRPGGPGAVTASGS